MPSIVNINRGRGINTSLLSQAMMYSYNQGMQEQQRKTELEMAMDVDERKFMREDEKERRKYMWEEEKERRKRQRENAKYLHQVKTEDRRRVEDFRKEMFLQGEKLADTEHGEPSKTAYDIGLFKKGPFGQTWEKKEKQKKEAYKVGTIRVFKKKINGKVMDVPHEWTGQDWQPKTELSGPSFKPEGPEYKPGEALKLIAEFEKQRMNFGKDNILTQFIVALNPDMAGMAGQQATPEVRKRVDASFDSFIRYLQQFIPEGFQQSPANLPQVTGELMEKKKTKPLDEETAKRFLQQAGGDKEEARRLAKEQGYTF
jgi:hypothetical protein